MSGPVSKSMMAGENSSVRRFLPCPFLPVPRCSEKRETEGPLLAELASSMIPGEQCAAIVNSGV